MRVGIGDRAAQLMPALDTTLGHESMAPYSPSRFPYDTADLFSDMYFEGLIAGYAIRMEINRGGYERLRERHRALIERISEAREL